MKPRFFRVYRSEHAYLTFITESYEGLCTVSTADKKAGIVAVVAPDGRESELEGLLKALDAEFGMEELFNFKQKTVEIS